MLNGSDDMKALIIIPAYNEEKNIRNTIADIRENASFADFIVINDCSTDDTEKVLDEMCVPHIDLPSNLGIGGCVQTGYLYAIENGYDVAIQFDGDGQHDAKYINELILPIVNGEANAVIGSRFISKEGYQSTGIRRFGIKFLSKLIKLLCGVTVLDITSGMRAVDKELILLYSQHYAQDYPEPGAALFAGMSGAKIIEVPVEMRERQFGSSSIRPLRGAYYMVKVTIELVFDRVTYRRSKE